MKRKSFKYLERPNENSKLLFIREAESKRYNGGKPVRMSEFVCDCGEKTIVADYAARSGKTLSCGCLLVESTRKRSTKHGFWNTRIYRIHQGMLRRCDSDYSPNYKNYGGRGITIVDEWRDFLKFKEWADENGYQKDLLLERVDNNKGYSPENCIWANWKTQSRNKRTSKYFYIDGIRFDSCNQAAKELSVSSATISRWCNGGKDGCWSEYKYPRAEA